MLNLNHLAMGTLTWPILLMLQLFLMQRQTEFTCSNSHLWCLIFFQPAFYPKWSNLNHQRKEEQQRLKPKTPPPQQELSKPPKMRKMKKWSLSRKKLTHLLRSFLRDPLICPNLRLVESESSEFTKAAK